MRCDGKWHDAKYCRFVATSVYKLWLACQKTTNLAKPLFKRSTKEDGACEWANCAPQPPASSFLMSLLFYWPRVPEGDVSQNSWRYPLGRLFSAEGHLPIHVVVWTDLTLFKGFHAPTPQVLVHRPMIKPCLSHEAAILRGRGGATAVIEPGLCLVLCFDFRQTRSRW